jgi:hypothetical protein
MFNNNNTHDNVNYPYQYHNGLKNTNEEWKGAKPLKFRSSIKIVPSLSKAKDQMFIPHKIQAKPPSSHEYIYVPSIKMVQPFQHKQYHSSKKFIVPKFSQPPEYNRINLSSSIQSKPYRQSSIGIVRLPEHLLQSQEFTIEDIMTRKKRLFNKLEGSFVPKNGVEYNSGFFEQGELIPGSSNVINKHKNSSILKQTIYDTMDISRNLLNRKKLWRYKSMNDILERDRCYVCNLENIDKNIVKDDTPQVASNAKGKNVGKDGKKLKNN